MNGSRPQAKPRLQGMLPRISPEHRAILNRWMREGLPYKEIVARCKSELGFQTSNASLSTYYSKHHAEIFGTSQENVHRVERTAKKPIELELTLRIQISPDLHVTSAKSDAVKVINQ